MTWVGRGKGEEGLVNFRIYQDIRTGDSFLLKSWQSTRYPNERKIFGSYGEILLMDLNPTYIFRQHMV